MFLLKSILCWIWIARFRKFIPSEQFGWQQLFAPLLFSILLLLGRELRCRVFKIIFKPTYQKPLGWNREVFDRGNLWTENWLILIISRELASSQIANNVLWLVILEQGVCLCWVIQQVVANSPKKGRRAQILDRVLGMMETGKSFESKFL